MDVQKIRLVLAVVVTLCLLTSSFTGFAKSNEKSIEIFINAASIVVDGNAAKIDNFSYGGAIYMQARDICSLLNREYMYDTKLKVIVMSDKKPAKAVTLAKQNFASVKPMTKKKIKVVPNTISVIVNGKAVKSDNLNYSGAFYVKVKDIVGLLGYDNSFDNASKKLTMTEKKPSTPSLAVDNTKPTNGNVTVTISNWGNAVRKEYRINDGEWQSYTEPVVVSENGKVYARGANAAGTYSDVSSFEITNIDKTPPSLPEFSPSTKEPTKNSVTVTIDNWGDAETKEYKVDNGEWQKYTGSVTVKDNSTIYARGTDSVGNVSESASYKVSNIDKTPPSRPSIRSNTTKKTKGNVTITIDSWGDADIKEYRVDNDSWQTYTGPFKMSKNGTVYARGTDKAGNTSATGNYKVDNILTLLTKVEVSQNAKSVVKVTLLNRGGKEIGSGSGFIISDDGTIVTNYHVIDMAAGAEVTTENGKIYKVSGIKAYSVEKDLAVLKLENARGLTPVILGNSDDLALGEEIVAIGYPLGLQNTVSFGNISSINPNLSREGYKDILITAPISPGSSGGALFNMYGEVVGVTFATITEGQNMNYAIPINDLTPMLSVNDNKTFDQVKREVYKDMSLEDFSEYISLNYSSYTSGSYKFEFDFALVTDDEDDPNMIYVYPVLSAKQYNYFISVINKDNNKSAVEEWMKEIMTEARMQYRDKNVVVGIVLFDYFSSIPSLPGEFTTISYDDSTGMYMVFSFLMFMENIGGQVEAYWII